MFDKWLKFTVYFDEPKQEKKGKRKAKKQKDWVIYGLMKHEKAMNSWDRIVSRILRWYLLGFICVGVAQDMVPSTTHDRRLARESLARKNVYRFGNGLLFPPYPLLGVASCPVTGTFFLWLHTGVVRCRTRASLGTP